MASKEYNAGADTPPIEKTGEAHIEHGSDVALDHTPFSRMTAEERAAALKMAHDADPGPPTFSMAYLRFFLTCVVVFVNSCDTGFDTTIMSSVNSMLQFQEFFGLTSSATGTSLVFGIFTVGGVTAFFANIILPDLIGRRWSMLYGNTLLIAGAILSGTARSMPQLLGGRWLTGFGASTAALSAKTYMAEITSPFNRGRYMGVLNSFYYVGQILATGVAIPLGKIQSEYSWRVCLFLQCAPAIVNVLFVYFIAESPRWLYARNRKDEAIAILARYHSATGDVNSPIIRIEIEEIEESISVDGADRRFWDFSKLFNSHSNRYRFGLCAMMSVWGQLSGNGMITYFLPTLLGLAGITNRDRQRELNLVNSVTSMIGALTGSAIVDHVGRRKLMLTGVGCAAIGMLIVGCLLSPAGEQSKMRADAGVSFIFLFMVAFSFGFTPLQGLYPAEVLTFENRAKGLSLQAWVTSGVSTINTFGLPVALAKVGYIMYLIFFAWDIVGFAVIWFFAVETKQLSLEEMEEVFSAPKPKQRSFELAREARARARAAKKASASVRV